MREARKISVLFAFLFISSALFGQEDPVSRIWNEIDSLNLHAQELTDQEDPGTKRLFFNTTLGTSFSYTPYFGSAMNLYASPHAEYRATNRLSFHSGLMVSHAIPMQYNANPEYPLTYNINTLATYVSTSYQLTEKLYVHGTGTIGMAIYPSFTGGKASYMQYKDLSFGATYKLGNFSIGATIHHSDSPFPGLPYGIGHNRFASPYYW